jgi:hypothetical protein
MYVSEIQELEQRYESKQEYVDAENYQVCRDYVR